MKRKLRSAKRTSRRDAKGQEPVKLTLKDVMLDLDPGWEIWQKPGREFHTRSTL